MKIKNKEKDYLKSDELNDKDILNIILLYEKMLGNNYSVMLSEMSNRSLYNEVESILIDTKLMGHDAYELAFSNGWYTLEEASDTKIENVIKKFTKTKEE